MPKRSAESILTQDVYFMELALKQAQLALENNEVPVGALLVENNHIISKAYNQKENGFSATYHAEILAIEKASLANQSWRLSQSTLYVTLEPCIMCSGALVAARVKRLVYGATDPKGGGIESIYQIGNNPKLNHQLEVTKGVLKEPCSQILKNFFKAKRS